MRPLDRPFIRFALPVLLASIAIVSGCQWIGGQQTDVSTEDQPRTVYALGRLEPASGVIDVRATPGDRLRELDDAVRENSLAPSDGILGTLDSYDMGKAQLIALLQKREIARQKHKHQKQLAAAQLAQARATVAEVVAKQKELALQGERLVVLSKARDLASLEYERLAALRAADPNLVTKHQLDKKQNEKDLAAKDYDVAFGTHAAATEAAIAGKIAADSALKVAAIANSQSQEAFETALVKQEIDVAREALKRSVLLAPNYSKQALYAFVGVDLAEIPTIEKTSGKDSALDGRGKEKAKPPAYTVLKILARRGEAVTQLPVIQMGDLGKMICIAEVHEADVKEVFLGQKVTIRSAAFSKGYANGKLDRQTGMRSGGIQGNVVHIGRMIAPPGLANRNPLAPADRSVVEVRIDIDVEATANAIDQAKAEAKDGALQIDKRDDDALEDANAHAAKHVGLQVTVEFGKKANGGGRAQASDDRDSTAG